MKIAFAHFRVGETDGVSLEMDKWKSVLERAGHECFYIAGSEGTTKAFIISEMHYQGQQNNKFVDNCYRKMQDYANADDLKKDIFEYAGIIERKLIDLINCEKIDIVIPNNIWSLGWHLPCGIAFKNAAKKLPHIRFIGHNHDFYWERPLYSNPCADFVHSILNDYFVPKLPNVEHCVINAIAQCEVKARRNIDTTIVPNVFDFDNMPLWEKDEYNSDLRERFGIAENDIVVLQATRITERKAIEFGIDVVAEMSKKIEEYREKVLYSGQTFDKDAKIHYVFAGLDEGVNPDYFSLLQEKMQAMGVLCIYINKSVDHSRCERNGEKKYSLWDIYTMCDIITYTSILEGWGNQLLEAIFAKKPIILFEYPVYKETLFEYGLDVISLGWEYQETKLLLSLKKKKVGEAATKACEILFNAQEYQRVVEKNFRIGKEKLSYTALQVILEEIIKK